MAEKKFTIFLRKACIRLFAFVTYLDEQVAGFQTCEMFHLSRFQLMFLCLTNSRKYFLLIQRTELILHVNSYLCGDWSNMKIM